MLKVAAVRYIPKGSVEIPHPTGLGVVYTHEYERGPAKVLTYAVIAYCGNASKKAFYESYGKPEARQKRIDEFFAGLTASELAKQERKAERNKPHTLKPGDIIHHSWGWEQTNCDYYQVLSVTGHGATIREIQSRTVENSEYPHGMADMRLPVKDAFCGEPLKVRVNGYGNITTLEHGSAGLWNGKPNYCSWYA